jgi:hypothetical protein
MKSAILAAALVAATPANYNFDNEVDAELILAVDISQSMGDEEQELQRAGYAAALVSREFLDAIDAGPLQRVAIAYMEWGGTGEQFVVADWQIIDGPDSAAHLADEILSAPVQKRQRTSIADALTRAGHLVSENEYQGLRKVIDISGDGPNNQGGSVVAARDALVADGFTINGLPLKLKKGTSPFDSMMDIADYYADCVIGGPGSFVEPVRSAEAFPAAVKRKLVAEIAGLQPQIIHASTTEPKPIDCGMFD